MTAFVPDFLRNFGGNEKGAAAMFEYRLKDAFALGVDAKLGLGDASAKRLGGGIFAKAYSATVKTILMGQVDLAQVQGGTGAASNQLTAYFGPTVFPVRGFWNPNGESGTPGTGNGGQPVTHVL